MFDHSAPFALIQRDDAPDLLLLTGTVRPLETLSQIPRGSASSTLRHHSLNLIPFSQARERGFQVHQGDEQILCLEVMEERLLPLAELLRALPSCPVTFGREPQFDESSEAYLAAVRRLVDEEIARGAGSSFVLPRCCRGQLADFTPAVGLAIFRRILESDYGTYWKFAFYDGRRFFVGSTPERHLEVRGGKVSMMPISGTLRKAGLDETSAPKALRHFLADEKELHELFMVVDEELKMLTELCPAGGRLHGPYLREMSRLIHSEYHLEGESDADLVELLRGSLFAATVTGSPVESAFQVIARHESQPRRYYAGALALFGHDETGQEFLDSPILIRTVEIDEAGEFQFRVGATLVRDSDPASELAETEAKGAAVLAALCGKVAPPQPPLLRRLPPEFPLEQLLQERNSRVSTFWSERQCTTGRELNGSHLLLVDQEDGFASMLAHLLRSLGATVELQRWNQVAEHGKAADLVILGPGPGDPRDDRSEKMRRGLTLARTLVAQRRPLLGICLGHQLLGRALGLELRQGQEPSQGQQRNLSLFGEKTTLGFYNSFWVQAPSTVGELDCASDELGRLIALRGPTYGSFQFHPESILTLEGRTILAQEVQRLLQSSSSGKR